MPTGIIQAQESHSSERLTDLPTPIADGDAATKKYVDDNAGGGGATAFTDLSDVPASYSGQALKLSRVNAGETALEFVSTGTLSTNIVDDTAYDATTWNADTTHAPSKNAVRDKIEAMGGGIDLIQTTLGTPDTAYEFNTSATVGTAVGTATAEDWNTTVPSCYYVKKNATSGAANTGRYVAVSAPVTVVAKVIVGTLPTGNFTRLATLFVGESTPGKMAAVSVQWNTTLKFSVDYFTNPTTFGSTPAFLGCPGVALPMYLAIVATSTSSVAYYVSYDGYGWVKVAAALNPSFTIGSAGIAVDPEISALNGFAAFDYLRIWNSAKTLIN